MHRRISFYRSGRALCNVCPWFTCYVTAGSWWFSFIWSAVLSQATKFHVGSNTIGEQKIQK